MLIPVKVFKSFWKIIAVVFLKLFCAFWDSNLLFVMKSMWVDLHFLTADDDHEVKEHQQLKISYKLIF